MSSEKEADHVHTADCYVYQNDQQNDMTNENEADHVLTDDCYADQDEQGNEMANENEADHIHTDDCYADQDDQPNDMANENQAAHVHTDHCYAFQDADPNGVSDGKVDHSVIEDPAFRMFYNIQHALYCVKVACDHPACAPTRTLLHHVYACADETCEYPECGEALVLLHHYADPAGIQGHISAECPLCRKRAVLMRIHPGKGPRSFDDQDYDEEDQQNEEAPTTPSAKDNCSIIRKRLAPIQRSSTYSSAKRARLAAIEQARKEKINEEIRIARESKIREGIIDLYEHIRTCKVLCSKQYCLNMKRSLMHIRSCRTTCESENCARIKRLLIHYINCAPQDNQCTVCFKRPPYRGKDYFADMNSVVLRNIARFLEKDTKALNALQQVNKRVYSFFNFPGEIKGLFSKEMHEMLIIEQLRDGSLYFRFCCKYNKGGYIHILNKNGEAERIRYTESKSKAAEDHVKRKYGLIVHKSGQAEPIALPPSFFDALALALQKYEFTAFCACSVILNFDELNQFFIGHRDDDTNTHFFGDTIISLKNVRIV